MFADRTNWNLKPNRLAEALARHRAGGRALLDLTTSNPTECGFEYEAPAIVRALCSPASLQYHPDPRGLMSARRAVRDYYAARADHVSPNDLLLTASTSEAYSFVFRLLCNPGDELLIPTPSYPLFDFLAEVNDVKLTRYPLFYDHGWHIDLHALEQAITPRTRGIIVVHPNNPTGHYTKTEEIAHLNQVCAASKLAIIADEVFLDFSLTAASQKSFVANTATLTFTMSGISKISGLPQMKFAWLAVNGPEELKREALGRLEMIADTYLPRPFCCSSVRAFSSNSWRASRKISANLIRSLPGKLTQADWRLKGAGMRSCAFLQPAPMKSWPSSYWRSTTSMSILDISMISLGTGIWW